MIYISKGVVKNGSVKEGLAISHCGRTIQLTGTEAALWLNGRFSFAILKQSSQKQALLQLERMGLAEWETEDSSAARYRLLTRCICCPAKASAWQPFAGREERAMVTWLRYAGLRLTVAELVYLAEHRIEPKPELLGQENRQALVETIYTQETIEDNLLEHQMEEADCRDEVVNTLIALLRKKKIVLL